MSMDAEQSVLGAMIKSPEAFSDGMEIFQSDVVFADQRHRAIFQAMQKLWKAGEPCDIQTLRSALGTQLPKIGGGPYLCDLVERVPTAGNVKTYAKDVLESYLYRRIGELARKLSGQCERRDATIEDLIIGAQRQLNDLAEGRLQTLLGQVPEPIGRDISQFVDAILSEEPCDQEDHLVTGIPNLDRRVQLFSGELSVVAGPPSIGKTSFAVGVLLENVSLGKTILYFTLDQIKKTLVRRFLTNRTGITRRQFLARDLTQDQKDRLSGTAADLVLNDRAFVVVRSGMTVADMLTTAKLIKRKYGLDGIVIDYVQQVRAARQVGSRTVEMGEVITDVKRMAKELDVHVMVLSQLNRSYDALEPTDVPRMTMLRWAGEIEQEANVILFPWVPLEVARKKYGEHSKQFQKIKEQSNELPAAYVIIAKDKEGETGTIGCLWHPERMAFCAETNRAEPES